MHVKNNRSNNPPFRRQINSWVRNYNNSKVWPPDGHATSVERNINNVLTKMYCTNKREETAGTFHLLSFLLKTAAAKYAFSKALDYNKIKRCKTFSYLITLSYKILLLSFSCINHDDWDFLTWSMCWCCQVLHLIAERGNICQQIHLPAQSGSSKVLKAMRRG